MSTHNLCFGVKIRKIDTQLHTSVLLYKSWINGVHISRTYLPDVVVLFYVSECLHLVLSVIPAMLEMLTMKEITDSSE